MRTPEPPPLPDDLETLLHRLRLPHIRRAAPVLKPPRVEVADRHVVARSAASTAGMSWTLAIRPAPICPRRRRLLGAFAPRRREGITVGIEANAAAPAAVRRNPRRDIREGGFMAGVRPRGFARAARIRAQEVLRPAPSTSSRHVPSSVDPGAGLADCRNAPIGSQRAPAAPHPENPMPTKKRPLSALVTGASRGIGRQIALHLAARGVRVGVHYLKNRSAARSVLAALPGKGHAMFQADIADADSVERLWRRASRRLGPIGIVVNNAAVHGNHHPRRPITGPVQVVGGDPRRQPVRARSNT